MKHIYILLVIFVIIYILFKNNYLENLTNYPIPTFHILISSNGRRSILQLLHSLRDQLLENDAITIVFDGPDAYDKSTYNDSWLIGHKSKINVITQDENTGYWGHPIRQKYVSLLNPKTTFIMHADDDDIYLPNSFNKLRMLCTDPNVLYIAKMNYSNDLNKIIPSQNEDIIEGDIGNPNGITPFNLAPLGKWGLSYTGDFEYYNTLQQHVNKIVFLDEIIYRVR
jgi:hypothetical protein